MKNLLIIDNSTTKSSHTEVSESGEGRERAKVLLMISELEARLETNS